MGASLFPIPAMPRMWRSFRQASKKARALALLWYDKTHKQFYLLVSLEVETAAATPHPHTSVVGVDVGVRYLAVTSDTKGGFSFHTGKQVELFVGFVIPEQRQGPCLFARLSE